MKTAVSWDIKTEFVLHRSHITSPLQSSRLMLCKIWGFHSGDYEEYRLLGYKIPVRTSQETQYISLQSSRLMLCKIWGFHGGDYEECGLLVYDTVWLIRTDVLEECIATIIMVGRMNQFGTELLFGANVFPTSPIRLTLLLVAIRPS
jgi:hypothetical protein